MNFEYEKYSNGNPSLLIPNIDPICARNPFNRIEFDQSASHLHDAPEFGVELPKDFDMSKYKALPTKLDKIKYAKQHVPPEIIISYQNAMGLAMSSSFTTGAKIRLIQFVALLEKES